MQTTCDGALRHHSEFPLASIYRARVSPLAKTGKHRGLTASVVFCSYGALRHHGEFPLASIYRARVSPLAKPGKRHGLTAFVAFIAKQILPFLLQSAQMPQENPWYFHPLLCNFSQKSLDFSM